MTLLYLNIKNINLCRIEIKENLGKRFFYVRTKFLLKHFSFNFKLILSLSLHYEI